MKKKKPVKAFDKKIFFRLLKFASAYRTHFLVAASTAILIALFASARPIILDIIINKTLASNETQTLGQLILIMLALLIGEVFFQFIFIYRVNWMGQHIIKDIRLQLQKHMLQFKMGYFANSSVGKLVTRLVSDTETISKFFSEGLFMIISDLLKMLVVAFIMLWMNFKLALIAFLVLPFMVYATKVFQKAIKGAFQEVRIQIANLNGFVQERIVGIKILQLFNREKESLQQFNEINEKHKKAHIRTIWYYSIFFPIAEILSSIAVGLIVWYGSFDIIKNGITNPGHLFAFIMMTQMLFRPLRQIADKFNTLQLGMIAGNRVFEIMDTSSRIPNEGNIKATHLKGAIKFKDVYFNYKKDEPVLKGISFDVKEKETVAIVGATGAGKSTLINLMNRFYDISKGEIQIDGTPIKEYSLNSLRSQIAVVLQDVFLFSDSIYNNIVLNNTSISLETVIQAAKEINMHEFIMSLPNNYHYNVKERGVMLSSGQRQLIAFLRAYVHHPSILILDEATSSIDSNSEKLIQQVTHKITKNQTSIIIAHRLATIKNASKIIVLDDGKIMEMGTHEALLKKEGYYKNLYDIQFKDKPKIAV